MTEAAASGSSGGRVDGFRLRGAVRLLSEERLSRRATSGDQRAFAEIFRRYHQDLYRFCLATVSNPQDAQEALQNTMVKAIRALPGEQREIKLKPWLYRIARNEAVETLRKRRDTVELSSERIASQWEIAEAASARERLRALFSDLAELPERQRSALVMRELAGLDFEEIGDAFGTTPAVARQTLYEARLGLRQMEEGREMSCEAVRWAISNADGRVTRRRDIRAHLRACAGCRSFRDDIAQRSRDLAAIAPLPLALSAGLVQGALTGQASGAALGAGGGVAAGGAAGGTAAGGVVAAGGLAGGIGVGAGKTIAMSAVVKSAAVVAITAVGVGAADRGGVIDLPVGGSGDAPAAKRQDRPAGSKPETQAGSASAPLGSNPSRAGQAGDGHGGRNGENRSAASPQQARGAAGGAGKPAKPPRSSRSKHAGNGAPGKSANNKPTHGRGGPPQGMPAASSHGQATAAERKPPQATSAPGSSGKSPGKAASAPQAEPAPKAESAPAAPPAKEAKPPRPSAEAEAPGSSSGKGGLPTQAPGS